MKQGDRVKLIITAIRRDNVFSAIETVAHRCVDKGGQTHPVHCP
jgi:hypothetical protein